MKITICGSMKLSKKMLDVKNELELLGHKVILPHNTDKYAETGNSDHVSGESAKNKIEHDLIRDYYRVIGDSDAVLIVNEELKGIKDYIGGNSFLEMAFGHVLNKRVYILNNIPDISYTDEIVAMQPIVLNGDLRRIS